MTDTIPRALCAACEATPGGCLSLHVLGGRACCGSCTHPRPDQGDQ